MSERDQSTPGPLADLRVLDLSAVPAGPGIARHLADFGADVIEVEPAGVGDTARPNQWPLPPRYGPVAILGPTLAPAPPPPGACPG